MSTTPRPPLKNHILASLPLEDYERIASHLEQVELPLGKVIQEAGEKITHVYFPERSMVSLVSLTRGGDSVEVGIVGFEGMVSVSAVLGVDKSPHEMLVQIHDGAMRLAVPVLLEEFKRAGALHDKLLRYTQGLLLQTSQVAVCNAKHLVSERLARWLLMSQDRCVCDELPFTHEFLSLMLGVRRAGVTEAAIILQAEECISYKRGRVKILDRQGLEEHTCDCYEVIKAEFNQLVS